MGRSRLPSEGGEPPPSLSRYKERRGFPPPPFGEQTGGELEDPFQTLSQLGEAPDRDLQGVPH